MRKAWCTNRVGAPPRALIVTLVPIRRGSGNGEVEGSAYLARHSTGSCAAACGPHASVGGLYRGPSYLPAPGVLERPASLAFIDAQGARPRHHGMKLGAYLTNHKSNRAEGTGPSPENEYCST